MGVSGAGKTTIGMGLSVELDASFIDADIFHSDANISKMKKGLPLNDRDREPWLLRLNEELLKLTKNRKSAVIACSALKESYRKLLFKNINSYLIIYLKANISTLVKRQNERKNHFFNPLLLESQIEILEPPEKKTFTINANQPKELILQEIISKLDPYGI
jgi:carbohydrate kinase (thermoresistant glucokinase family)